MTNFSEKYFILTNRELEVTQLIAEGKSNKEIGQLLVLSEFTVKVHVHKIFEKLGADNRAHVVYLAMQMGLIS